MIALVEGACRQKTPNEIALDILIAGMTLILLVAVVTLQPMAVYDKAIQSTVVLVALFVCLAPTTIGGLLSAIGIAGMDRMVQRNVLAMSGRAVEAAGDRSTLLLDKTGTSPTATGWRPSSSRSAASRIMSSPRPPCCHPRPTRRQKAAPSSTSRRSACRWTAPDLSTAELVPFTARPG